MIRENKQQKHALHFDLLKNGTQMTTPNILILMVDQLNGTLFPDGPAEWLHAPNLKKLAARSVRFQNCYTASPCAHQVAHPLCRVNCHR